MLQSKFLAFFLFFIVRASFAQEPLVDAAFAADKSTLYFIRKDKVVQYDRDFNKIVATKRISEMFPGVVFTQIDAALDDGEGNVYFFSGSDFICYNKKKKWAEAGYPKAIDGTTWAGLAFQPIDAAVNWPNEKCFFFGGNNYVRYHQKEAKVEEEYPKAINLNTWPGVTFDQVDAALLLSPEKVLLFRNEQFISFDIPSDKMDATYPKDIRIFPGLKEALLTGGESADKFNYDKFITIENQNYSVKQAGVDLLFDSEQKTIPYKDFKNKTHQLYPWYGKHIVYLTKEKELDKQALYLLLAFSDKYWEKMQDLVGKKSPQAHQNYLIEGRSTIALLQQSSCGEGCANSGFNGVEMMASHDIYQHIIQHFKAGSPLELESLVFDLATKNFAIFEKKLCIDDKKNDFNSHQLMTGTFQTICTPFVLKEAGIPVEKKATLAELSKQNVLLLQSYLTNPEKTIENTVLQKVDHTGAASYKLLGSILFFISQNYGGYPCLERMWKATSYLQTPSTPQDVLDNYFVLACFGAQTNLTKLFEHNFKYKITDRVRQEVQEYAKRKFQ